MGTTISLSALSCAPVLQFRRTHTLRSEVLATCFGFGAPPLTPWTNVHRSCPHPPHPEPRVVPEPRPPGRRLTPWPS